MMMNPEQPSITPESGEHSFLEMLKIWLGFGGMTEAFFSQELSRVSVRNTWIGILLASVLASFFSVALMLLNAAIAAASNGNWMKWTDDVLPSSLVRS